MNQRVNRILLIFSLLLIHSPNGIFGQEINNRDRKAEDRLKSWRSPLIEFVHIGNPRIDSVTTLASEKAVNIYFSAILSYYPLREEHIPLFNESLTESLGRKYRKHTVKAFSNGYSLEQLVPNSLRRGVAIDSSRIVKSSADKKVLVRKKDDKIYSSGLQDKAIALWQSHGYFYEATLDRWEFQRAQLFGTVEDLSTMAYLLPYLTPMLESAGAYTLIPRERDFNKQEIIVDNDLSTAGSEVVIHLPGETEVISSGFLMKDTLFTSENPFRMGTSLRIRNNSALYIPDFKKSGEYAVYVSWPRRDDNSTSVLYNVNHSGGTTGFIVNQTIGGPTWTYLGTFIFDEGKDSIAGSVSVSDSEGGDSYIGLDAIKFGGGMGNVARRPQGETIGNQRSVEATASVETVLKTDASLYSWKTSTKPRFIEGSRYFLQYAGMPDSLVYTPTTNKNDYNDDYQSRGLWVNYLLADPGKNLTEPMGMGIPIDMAFAFHTDAGITPDDSIIGTLAIYSTASDEGLFPNGSSRMASRDLSDLIQSQIVNDVRLQFNPEWTRRGLWDRPYAEARRPNVPTMLLELLSHQNQADQVFGLDPRFRFVISRSIYKGILKYFAFNENREYVVQPLPVQKLAIAPAGDLKIRLSWAPQEDPLEPTATANRYRVYKRIGNSGFDNGIITGDTIVDIELDAHDIIYSFKVTAINDGGESFPSEILAAGVSSSSQGNVLIVNGFDRVSGPEWFDSGAMAGVAWWSDRGVARNYEISPVGDQYDFDRKSPWIDDDAPGWGASYAGIKGEVIPGNTSDFSMIHGASILKAGYSFYSVSDEYFCEASIPASIFGTVDILMGEEKTTPLLLDKTQSEFSVYTPAFMNKLMQVSQDGMNIFLTGSYVGTDLQLAFNDSTALKFASRYLGFKPRTGHAVNNGNFYSTDIVAKEFKMRSSFNTNDISGIYAAEAPDAIEPAGRGSVTAFRYNQNNTSAGIMYKGSYKTVVLGFPFETIQNADDRDALMKQVLDFFKK